MKGKSMALYCMNNHAQSNGDHEVHNLDVGSSCLPAVQNRISLGPHPTCHSAVATARLQYLKLRINGCYYCANACHTS